MTTSIMLEDVEKFAVLKHGTVILRAAEPISNKAPKETPLNEK